LLPEAILFGEVKDENGAPLEGVTVRAQQWQELDGEKQFVPAGSAFTDDEGNFRLAELKPGRYYLSFLSTNGGWTITYQSTSEKPEEQGYGANFIRAFRIWSPRVPSRFGPALKCTLCKRSAASASSKSQASCGAQTRQADSTSP